MHVPLDGIHSFDPLQMDAPNTVGDSFHEKAPTAFHEHFQDDLQDLHPGMVALIADSAKQGKRGWSASRSGRGGRRQVSLIDQITLVRLLGGTVVEAQVIPARGFQALMAEDLLDVANGTTVEQ